MTFLVVGAGFSGAVVARELADAGHRVVVVDSRSHVAGNCHTSREPDSGVMVHRYGPHLFHTRRAHVATYLARFAELRPNQHRVRATTRSGVYSMPLNLLSMNQFFGTKLDPAGMMALIDERRVDIERPANFEEQALSMMGSELYEEFFAGYTVKQWGRDPKELPASVLKRLPMRFEYDDRYFQDDHEFLLTHGYTAAIENILDHDLITVRLETPVAADDTLGHDHVVWTGPLDTYFGHRHGRLAYRTLDFDWKVVDKPYQGCAVMNYCERDIPHTRVAEHNYFEPWNDSTSKRVIGVETSRECDEADIPYYPVRLADDHALLAKYVATAHATRGVTFVGRLGTYRYLDMDASIDEALTAARTLHELSRAGSQLPSFCSDPMT